MAVFGPVGHFEELLKQPMDTNKKNLLGEIPLCASVCAGRVELVEALVRAGTGPEAGLLREAVKRGDIGIVEALMRGGAVIQIEVRGAAYARHWRLTEQACGAHVRDCAGFGCTRERVGLGSTVVAAKPGLAALDWALREAVRRRCGSRSCSCAPARGPTYPVLAWAASYGDTAVVRLLRAHSAKWRHFSEWRDNRELAATEKKGIDALARALVATRPDPGCEWKEAGCHGGGESL
jgi:hypothetical protein